MMITLTRKSTVLVTLFAVLILVLGTAGGAVAGRQITSNQIKDKTVKLKDLHPSTRSQLQGIHNYEIVKQTSTATTGAATAISASCPHPNQKILSVSASFENSLALTSTSIFEDHTGTARTDGTGLTSDDVLRVQIVCAFVN